MSYIPTEWGPRVAISLAAMNKIESQWGLVLEDLAVHVAAGHPTAYRPKADMDQFFWSESNDGEASGLGADTLEGVHASAIAGGVASGIMGWWNPENGAVPAGYLFCDGQNGTMDMRNRFPIGASGTLTVGSAVGNANITPEGTVTIAGYALTTSNIFHTHTAEDHHPGNPGADAPGPLILAANENNQTISTASVGSGNLHDHPGTFTGDAKTLDPLFQHLVIIQKS
jgi:hypothetical protein